MNFARHHVRGDWSLQWSVNSDHTEPGMCSLLSRLTIDGGWVITCCLDSRWMFESPPRDPGGRWRHTQAWRSGPHSSLSDSLFWIRNVTIFYVRNRINAPSKNLYYIVLSSFPQEIIFFCPLSDIASVEARMPWHNCNNAMFSSSFWWNSRCVYHSQNHPRRDIFCLNSLSQSGFHYPLPHWHLLNI